MPSQAVPAHATPMSKGEMSTHDKHKLFKRELMEAILMWEAKVKLMKFQTKQATSKSGSLADMIATAKTSVEAVSCASTVEKYLSEPGALEVVRDMGLDRKIRKNIARVRYCARKSRERHEAEERKIAAANKKSLEKSSNSPAQDSSTLTTEEEDQDMDGSSADGAVAH